MWSLGLCFYMLPFLSSQLYLGFGPFPWCLPSHALLWMVRSLLWAWCFSPGLRRAPREVSFQAVEYARSPEEY